MLKVFLINNFGKYEDEIKKYIINHKNKQITGTIFNTYKEYENCMQIYRSNKKLYCNELEAFVSLWVTSLIDTEEWHDYFEPTTTFANDIYNNWLKEDLAKYTFNNESAESLKDYILMRANRMKELIQEYRSEYPLEQYNLKYPNSMPGIYLNRNIVDEKQYTLSDIQNIITAEELNYHESWAGYKEIFIETEQEYIYFSE